MNSVNHKSPLLSVRDLKVTLGRGAATAQVLHGVTFEVHEGTTVGLVGESGSGKSTLSKAIVGIHRPSGGAIQFAGEELASKSVRERRTLLRQIQMIPQDPYSSLDPRRTIGQTLAEAIDPQRASATKHRSRVLELLDQVSLPAAAATRYPSDFSGGQRQRIAIARSLAVQPQLIIADEITSALDLTTQAEVLELLQKLRVELGLTMVFVSHNLAVVREVSDEVVVLLQGSIVESGDAERVFLHPEHPYTQQLLDSVPGAPGFRLD